MNAIGFAELGLVEGLFEPEDGALAAADVGGCVHRGEESSSGKGVRYAVCALLSQEAGRSVGVDHRTCQVCTCHGPAAPETNPYLQKHIVQCAFSGTIAGTDADGPLTPTDSELETAISNVKRWRGEEAARRFVDALVYHESVTPEKAVELVESHGLAAGEG